MGVRIGTVLVWLSCAGGISSALAQEIVFHNVTAESGVVVSPAMGSQQTLPTGLGWADVDGDGLSDLVAARADTALEVFKNLGGLHFSPLQAPSGEWPHLAGDVRGLIAADYDNDGDADLFVSIAGDAANCALLRNDKGQFVDVSVESGVEVDGDGRSAAWGDYDADGLLDLYVGRLWPRPNLLFRGIGDGAFQLVGEPVAPDAPDSLVNRQTTQVLWLDVDRDGWVDLFELNERCYLGYQPNRLWLNQQGSGFVEASAEFGLNVCLNPAAMSVRDYDGDGRFDFYLANPQAGNVLLRTTCTVAQDVTVGAGLETSLHSQGVVLEDFNHDSWPDLYVANSVEGGGDSSNLLYHNHQGLLFEASSESSDVTLQGHDSSTVLHADLDQDGDFDLVVAGFAQSSIELLRNDSEVGHSLRVQLVGSQSNRDGIGAVVELLAGGRWRRQARAESRCWAAACDPTLLFGLGELDSVQRLVVHWPSGVVQVIDNPPVDELVVVVEEASGEASSLYGELCGDGIDNDCDGDVDEGFSVGGSCAVGVGECVVEGSLTCAYDQHDVVCDAIAASPASEIVGDELDNDCDGETDESPISPPACEEQEVCDGADNTCDGIVDEGFELGQPCEEGEGLCMATGLTICAPGGMATVCSAVTTLPEAEICGDGFDNDCDAETDEGFDLGARCQTGVGACSAEGEMACAADGLSSVCVGFPGASQPELCGDGIDNDCDGELDEGFDVGAQCWMGEGACRRPGRLICAPSGQQTLCDATPGAPQEEEAGDGLDNDCDGQTDEEPPAIDSQPAPDGASDESDAVSDAGTQHPPSGDAAGVGPVSPSAGCALSGRRPGRSGSGWVGIVALGCVLWGTRRSLKGGQSGSMG